MSGSIEDDAATSSGEDETILTPRTESGVSSEGTETGWLFQGELLDPFLEDNYRPQSAPALAVHRGRLFCLWTGGRGSDSPLTWSSLSDLGQWDYAREVLEPAGAIKRSVNAAGAPAIADLNGVLHLVFLERNEDLRSSESPPTHRGTLVHMQYDDQCRTWCKRTSLGVSACPYISLKGHEGYLYCGYIASSQELCYSMWNEIVGWSHSLLVADCLHTDRSFAFYNVGDSLHLLYTHAKGEVRNIHNLEYDRTACCWLAAHSASRLEEPFFGGLDVTSSDGRAYVIYRDNDRRPVLMTTDFEGRWTFPERVHSEASWEFAAAAIMNGTLISVWVGGPCSHRKLLWSQRPTMSPIPMNEWMSRIGSDVHLSELSIPGSHESCATLLVPWVQCQNMSIADQLKSGIRYFDFRCGVTLGTLYLFHGRSPLGFTLTEVLARMYAWLARVPREAIMVQIKMEGGTGDGAAFEELLRSEFTKNNEFWALGHTIPTLGAIRGKIQLMRRFDISSGMLGIDVRRWADNCPKFIIPIEQHERMVVQDRYEYTDVVPTFTELVRTKLSAVDALITAARDEKNLKVWYLNWCNAYALPRSLGVVASPADIAIGRNDVVGGRRHFVPGVNSSLSKQSFLAPVRGRYGTILLDFAETPHVDLVAAIVMTNTFKLADEGPSLPIC